MGDTPPHTPGRGTAAPPAAAPAPAPAPAPPPENEPEAMTMDSMQRAVMSTMERMQQMEAEISLLRRDNPQTAADSTRLEHAVVIQNAVYSSTGRIRVGTDSSLFFGRQGSMVLPSV